MATENASPSDRAFLDQMLRRMRPMNSISSSPRPGPGMLHAVSLLTGVVDCKSRNACPLQHSFRFGPTRSGFGLVRTRGGDDGMQFCGVTICCGDAGLSPVACTGGGAESGTNGTETTCLHARRDHGRGGSVWWRALFAEGVGFVFCSRQIRVDREREFERIDGPRASDRLGFDSSRKADGSRLHGFGPSDRLGFDWSRSGKPIVPSCVHSRRQVPVVGRRRAPPRRPAPVELRVGVRARIRARATWMPDLE